MDPNLPALWGDEEKLVQAFLNIFLNAVQAVNEAGEIVLTTRLDPSRHVNKEGFVEGVIFVQVKNSGDPIPLEVIPSLFDPFFTTKKDGTGLGLPITHQIVTLHGGTLSPLCANGFTEFNIELPITEHARKELNPVMK